MIVKDIPSGSEQVGGGGHWTRDLEFSPDGKTLYVSVGSRSNNDDDDREKRRADILAFDPDGKNERVFACGHPQRRRPGDAPEDRRSSGPRSTSATAWATTSSPTTSRTSRRGASTAGPGTTSARTRTRATRASTRS